MYRIAAEIEGITAFLFNRYADDPESGVTGRKKTTEQKVDEAHLKVYRDEDGLYWPGWNVKRMLADGCKAAGLKNGRAALWPMVVASVFAQGTPRFDRSDYTIHTVMGRVPPRTGGYVPIRRPALDAGWRLSFDLLVTLDTLHPDALRESLTVAGELVGMGSWRPEFGRFLVRDWSVSR